MARWSPGIRTWASTPLFSDGEERYEQSVICFCDIPEADLGIHMKKYGPFGLAFTKEFLRKRGARPVYYVSTTTCGLGAGPPDDDNYVKDLFNELVEVSDRVMREMNNGTLIEWTDPRHIDLQRTLGLLLERECLLFIKGFDPNAPDEDPANTYMEREWRIAHGRREFTLGDVHRVFMPQEFARRFRDEFRDYHSQVSFVDPD